MTHSFRRLLALSAALIGTTAGAQTVLMSKMNADDHFKLFLSDNIAVPGIQFSQGLGWGTTYTSTALPPSTAPGSSFYLNIWVGDIGGSVSGLLGQFNLVGGGSCVFMNGGTSLKTLPNKLWRVTKPLPTSVTVPTPAGISRVRLVEQRRTGLRPAHPDSRQLADQRRRCTELADDAGHQPLGALDLHAGAAAQQPGHGSLVPDHDPLLIRATGTPASAGVP